MTRFSLATFVLTVCAVAVMLPQLAAAAPDEPFRWYGLGGEITSESGNPRRWLGRVGVTEQIGAEIVFAMAHRSSDDESCEITRLDFGGGVIYDVAPSAPVTPYFAGRMILNIAGVDCNSHHNETAGTVEIACGAEYVIMKRLGLSGELNFSFETDPTAVFTSTRVRAYFYF